MIPLWKTYIYKFIQPCSKVRGTHWGVVLPYHSRSAALGVTGAVWEHAWRDENLNSKGPPTCLNFLTEWCLRNHHDKMGHSWGSSQIFARFIWALISSTVTKMYKNFQCKAWHLKRFTSLVEFIWSINTSLCQMLSLEPWPFADPFAPGPCKTIEWHRVR